MALVATPYAIWVQEQIPVLVYNKISKVIYKTSNDTNTWIDGYIVLKTITSNSFLLKSRFFIQGRDKYQNEERLIQIRYLNSDDEIIYNLDVDILFPDFLVPIEISATFTESLV